MNQSKMKNKILKFKIISKISRMLSKIIKINNKCKRTSPMPKNN